MNPKPQTNDYVSCLENDVRLTHAGIALASDYGNSRAAAIELMCLVCCGGDKELGPAACAIQRCPLWLFRPGATESVAKGIPSKALLENRKRRNKLSAVGSAALASYRAAKKAANDA